MKREDKGLVSKKCISSWWKLELKSSCECPVLYDGCVRVATCRGLLFTSADNYRHLVFNYPRIIARRPRRLRTAAVMDREHGVNIVTTLRRHSASSTLLGWSPLLTSARSSCVRHMMLQQLAAINETIFKTWISRANFTVYIVFVICPKLDHFIIEFGLITIWYFWLSSVSVHCISC